MCEYCGCRDITLIGRFSDEHVEVINRCGDLSRAVATSDLELVRAAAQRLADLLWPHTQAEEVGLFTELAKDEDFAPTIASLCGEHTSLDAELTAIASGHLEGYPTFEVNLRRHIDHEENGLFPAAAVSITGEGWERIEEATHAFDHAHGIAHEH